MSIWNRNFFAGLTLGLALPGAVLAAAGLVTLLRMHSAVEAHRSHVGSAELRAPPFPDRTAAVASDWKLRNLDGEETSLSALQGNVVFVNRWATWCRPCEAEMPGIQRLYERSSRESVSFVVVSEESPEVVREFALERGWELPLFTTDDEGPSLLRSRTIPATFILDRSGQVVFRHIGAAQWDHESSDRFLNRLLAE